MPAKPIDTSAFAKTMRDRIVRPQTREILISRFTDSGQAIDLTDPPNCEGLGRIRHFQRMTPEGWPPNPLPIDPAARALGRPTQDLLLAQVFQNAACAWRCWYCFVPFEMLTGSETRASWKSADQLVTLYQKEITRPDVIDLSGGSPDLTPEWIVWMMDALEAQGLRQNTYLWSDDNLSTDYVFTDLTEAQRERLRSYPQYGRVCCFKGFDAPSFAFNTGARPEEFGEQFRRFKLYLELGLDLYGYVTLTGQDVEAARIGIPKFLDRLQTVHSNLPLRVVPLCIGDFSPTRERAQRGEQDRFEVADAVQATAIAVWNAEMERRFPEALRACPIVDVPMGVRYGQGE